MTRTNVFAGLLGAVAVLFFAAARFLPPIDTHAASLAALAGFTNQTMPLVAILLLGGLGLGALLFFTAPGQTLALQAAAIGAPWRDRRTHVLAASALCLLVIVLVPVWSAERGYFGTRLALMDAGASPYRDFEYAYGYAVAYLPYGLHKLGLSISVSLMLALCLAAIAGVVSFAVIVERCVANPLLRIVLFWALAVCEAFVDPGPSLNYNFARYALPFALLLLVCERAPRLGAGGVFLAVGAADFLLYMLSPEIALAFSAAVLAWLAIAWRELGVVRIAAAALAIAAVTLGLLLALPAMFATFGAYASAQNLMPVVPSLIMVMAALAFLGCAAVNFSVVLSIWRGGVAPARQASQAAGLVVLAAALLPALVGRAAPTITIAYGFVAIVMAAGYLSALGYRRAALLWTGLFVLFVAYSAQFGLREDAVFLRHRFAAPRPGPDRAVADFLKAKFPGAYDPLLAVHPPQRGITTVGYYPGWLGGDVMDEAGIARKTAELEQAPYYILRARTGAAFPLSGLTPQSSLHAFAVASAYPFALHANGGPRFGASFVAALYDRCTVVATVGKVVVCRLAKNKP